MTDEPRQDDVETLRASCSRFLHWHGRREAVDLLAELPADIAVDRYGEGGVVEDLERRVAELLGTPAAVFMTSGTMAQQIALRIHADRRGRRAVAFHPTCHLDLHEGRAYVRLHGLVGRPVGEATRLVELGDLEDVAEPLAAVLLELPQREIGGRLPAWDELVAQVAWARDRGAAMHLDGARLWECTPFYGRSAAEIASLFDTVYVSFYKGLGAISGCCLAGPDDVVAEAREWRTRHGGTLHGLWPYAASALGALDRRLPRMARYVEHAVAVADALRGLERVEVVPDPPVTPMMHLHLRTSPEAFVEAARRIATRDGLWTWERSWPTDAPAWQRVELVAGDATLDLAPAEVRRVVAELVGLTSP